MDYVEVEEARAQTGLRLVLTRDVPGPWGEAAKGILHVKAIDFTPVAQVAGDPNERLRDWTGQSSAPVAVWNDEPPCVTSRSILWLAERLAPTPALLPDDPAERAFCLGLCDEIHGENGLGWCRRLLMFDPLLRSSSDPLGEGPLGFMASKYGYSPEAVARAEGRLIEILGLFSGLLASQHRRGHRYFLGPTLRAVDIYWAAFAAMLAPLPDELCPMPDGMRKMYTLTDGPLADALPGDLLAHRDFVYAEHLKLPLDF